VRITVRNVRKTRVGPMGGALLRLTLNKGDEEERALCASYPHQREERKEDHSAQHTQP